MVVNPEQNNGGGKEGLLALVAIAIVLFFVIRIYTDYVTGTGQAKKPRDKHGNNSTTRLDDDRQRRTARSDRRSTRPPADDFAPDEEPYNPPNADNRSDDFPPDRNPLPYREPDPAYPPGGYPPDSTVVRMPRQTGTYHGSPRDGWTPDRPGKAVIGRGPNYVPPGGSASTIDSGYRDPRQIVIERDRGLPTDYNPPRPRNGVRPGGNQIVIERDRGLPATYNPPHFRNSVRSGASQIVIDRDRGLPANIAPSRPLDSRRRGASQIVIERDRGITQDDIPPSGNDPLPSGARQVVIEREQEPPRRGNGTAPPRPTPINGNWQPPVRTVSVDAHALFRAPDPYPGSYDDIQIGDRLSDIKALHLPGGRYSRSVYSYHPESGPFKTVLATLAGGPEEPEVTRVVYLFRDSKARTEVRRQAIDAFGRGDTLRASEGERRQWPHLEGYSVAIEPDRYTVKQDL